MRVRKSIAYALLIIAGFFIIHRHGRWLWNPIWLKVSGKSTVAEVQEKYGQQVKLKLEPLFKKADLVYPPEEMTLLAFKQERVLELWAKHKTQWVKIKDYPFTEFSGKLGPKLMQGDRQIPEGMYQVSYLNPNSSYHLSMKLNYPNEFDRKMAETDGRNRLGGDIFIHGKSVTIGCIPLGDQAIEELFCLVNLTGMDKVSVIISPCDFRKNTIKAAPQKSWVAGLYKKIESKVSEFR
ncbi:MAG: hypothetical protein HQL32_06855 [Planctomycetes bacterium]|nr:hypothetical protein [Planctomycetota bacterium]